MSVLLFLQYLEHKRQMILTNPKLLNGSVSLDTLMADISWFH